MNNFERYKDDEALKSVKFGLVKGKPIRCDDLLSCTDCDFCVKLCAEARMEWLKSEYEEPKINLPKDLPIDTKIEVSIDGEIWVHKHFAGFKDDQVGTWASGKTSWTTTKINNWKYARLPKEETDDNE
mgnify:CR=1 FL=1